MASYLGDLLQATESSVQASGTRVPENDGTPLPSTYADESVKLSTAHLNPALMLSNNTLSQSISSGYPDAPHLALPDPNSPLAADITSKPHSFQVAAKLKRITPNPGQRENLGAPW